MSKTVFLFPGQGAQSVGMGARLVETLPAARDLFQQATQVLGYDLAALCFNGPAAELDSTIRSQPALFVTSLAALEWMRAERPEIVKTVAAAAGLSLGEYTALVFAGAMDFTSGLKLVAERGAAMQEAADAIPSGMVSVLGLETWAVESLCDQARGENVLQVANYLCPGNIVVSGDKEACVRLAEMAPAAGAMKTIPLPVAGAFHTSIMAPAAERLSAALASVKLKKPRIPVISNVDAKPHDDPEEIRKLLLTQLTAPVRWEESMRWLMAQSFDLYYEVGPGRVLRGLLKRIDRKVNCEGVEV
ncbi:MAG: ACP S-malonyltransferase [Planctomycetes bacterium]|nr:ACP S-malonyltransferase [Planctomycetota bacterium]